MVVGNSVFIVGETIGTGRKIVASLSRVMPGGVNRCEEDDANDEAGSSLGVGGSVEIGWGKGKRFAYWRSSLAREGDGSGTLIKRLEWPEGDSSDRSDVETSRVRDVAIDRAGEDCCVFGV